ncbi:MAG TPA: hypothetical protein PK285_11525 [Bacteroidales bacterium]|jgi:hypothetical protein|nr:hypothetical protein [Bacteroidales bacterium]
MYIFIIILISLIAMWLGITNLKQLGENEKLKYENNRLKMENKSLMENISKLCNNEFKTHYDYRN